MSRPVDQFVFRKAEALVRRSALAHQFAEKIGNGHATYANLVICSFIYTSFHRGEKINRASVGASCSHLISRSTAYRLLANLETTGWLRSDNAQIVPTDLFLETYESLMVNMVALAPGNFHFLAKNSSDFTIWYDPQTQEYLFVENTEPHIGWTMRDLIGHRCGFITHETTSFPGSIRQGLTLVNQLPRGTCLNSPAILKHRDTGVPVYVSAMISSGKIGIREATLARFQVLDQITYEQLLISRFGTKVSQFETPKFSVASGIPPTEAMSQSGK